jgi:hypothetical protein
MLQFTVLELTTCSCNGFLDIWQVLYSQVIFFSQGNLVLPVGCAKSGRRSTWDTFLSEQMILNSKLKEKSSYSTEQLKKPLKILLFKSSCCSQFSIVSQWRGERVGLQTLTIYSTYSKEVLKVLDVPINSNGLLVSIRQRWIDDDNYWEYEAVYMDDVPLELLKDVFSLPPCTTSKSIRTYVYTYIRIMLFCNCSAR